MNDVVGASPSTQTAWSRLGIRGKWIAKPDRDVQMFILREAKHRAGFLELIDSPQTGHDTKFPGRKLHVSGRLAGIE